CSPYPTSWPASLPLNTTAAARSPRSSSSPPSNSICLPNTKQATPSTVAAKRCPNPLWDIRQYAEQDHHRLDTPKKWGREKRHNKREKQARDAAHDTHSP